MAIISPLLIPNNSKNAFSFKMIDKLCMNNVFEHIIFTYFNFVIVCFNGIFGQLFPCIFLFQLLDFNLNRLNFFNCQSHLFIHYTCILIQAIQIFDNIVSVSLKSLILTLKLRFYEVIGLLILLNLIKLLLQISHMHFFLIYYHVIIVNTQLSLNV